MSPAYTNWTQPDQCDYYNIAGIKPLVTLHSAIVMMIMAVVNMKPASDDADGGDGDVAVMLMISR